MVETTSRPVVVVSMDWVRRDDERKSLGAASIVASLREHGVVAQWIEEAVNGPDFEIISFSARVVETVRRLGPDVLVGLGCYIWNDDQVGYLLKQLAKLGVDVVLGGPQISFSNAGELDARYPSVRYFVRGYGETAMLDLALREDTNGVHGLYDTRDEDLGKRFDGELDTLPSPYLTGVLDVTDEVRWETQRGCPFRCSFCQHREPNRKHRNRPMCEDRIDAELRRFAAKGVKRISILDPIFHIKTDRAIALLRRARALGITATISLQCRFEMIREEFLDAMEGLNVVLEFGLQTVHLKESSAIGRKNKMDKVSTALERVRERNIDFEISLIFGLPEQTLESFLESVEWCLNQRAPRVLAWPLMLLPGTPLYEERERWGFVESEGRFREVVSSDTFSKEDNVVMREVAEWVRQHPGARTLPLCWHSLAVAS